MNRTIIIKPLVTEKSTAENAKGKYMFVVNKAATKIDVSHAFEKMYGAKTEKINIIYSHAKKRATKHSNNAIKRPEYKKAMITVKDNKTVDITKFASSSKTTKASKK